MTLKIETWREAIKKAFRERERLMYHYYRSVFTEGFELGYPMAYDDDFLNVVASEIKKAHTEGREEGGKNGWKDALEWVHLIMSYKSPAKVRELIERDLKDSAALDNKGVTRETIEAGAKDFANRFEGVMKELAEEEGDNKGVEERGENRHDFEITDMTSESGQHMGQLWKCKKCPYEHKCSQTKAMGPTCTHQPRFNEGCLPLTEE